MSNRKIAIMVDGGYFLKRLPSIVPKYDGTVDATAKALVQLCRSDIEWAIGERGETTGKSGWLQHVYRIFYYDARPYSGKSQHPFTGKALDYGSSHVAMFREELFERLRRQRKLALRLGNVVREGDWRLPARSSHTVLRTRELLSAILVPAGADEVRIAGAELEALRKAQDLWAAIDDNEPQLALRQKGVDMRLGLDVASITLKKQAETIILVAGDSDFVPAAKLARREGLEFILDPMWQNVNDDLFEHIDGLHNGLWRPGDGSESGR
jgi:uncharacterized LabA/DUF88 family protein